MDPRPLAGQHPCAGRPALRPRGVDDRLRLGLHHPLGFPAEARDVGGRDEAFTFEPGGIQGDRIARRPVRVHLAVGVALFGRRRVFPGGLRIAPEIQHVVMVRVAAHAHRDELDERRTEAAARPFGRPGERRGDGVGVGAVERDPRYPVAGGLVCEDAHGALIANRRRQRSLIVLHAENRRQPADGAQVDRFVPLAQGRAALADERDRHASGAFALERERHPGDGQRGDAERRGRRQDAARQIADVQVLAVERRTGLRHLRVQRHAHRHRFAAHGQRRSQIPDERRDDVARPRAVRELPLRAAAEPDRRGVDRLLSERSESLALERDVAVANVAAREERFQLVVDGPREDHPAQDLDALVTGQRPLDGGAPQKAVARIE